jgi:hypothetical protein
MVKQTENNQKKADNASSDQTGSQATAAITPQFMVVRLNNGVNNQQQQPVTKQFGEPLSNFRTRPGH